MRGQDLLSCLPGTEPERIPAHLGEELHEPLDPVIQCRRRVAGLSRAGPALLRWLERYIRAHLDGIVEETPGVDGTAGKAILPALSDGASHRLLGRLVGVRDHDPPSPHVRLATLVEVTAHHRVELVATLGVHPVVDLVLDHARRARALLGAEVRREHLERAFALLSIRELDAEVDLEHVLKFLVHHHREQ